MWRIGNAVHCWWGCKSVQPCWKQHGDSPRNKKIELPYDLAILRLDIYGKEIKTGSQGCLLQHYCRQTRCENKCTWTDECIKKICACT